jgi:hypothetical protein
VTIVILDPDGRAPYPDWLPGADLVLVTGSPVEAVRSGYREVRYVPGYASSATVERTVIELAGTITALVATATTDLVRAGALRDHLGIAGQGRDDATVFADPVVQRRLLTEAGVPAIPAGPVLRVADLYWYRDRWGSPLRIRRRKEPGWPTAAILRDEADVRAFTASGLAPSLITVPSLMAEPLLDGERSTVDDPPTALPCVPGQPYKVELLRTGTGLLVDTVAMDIEAGHRSTVLAQAGLSGEEVTRWAS